MSASSGDGRRQVWQRLGGQTGALRALRIVESPVYAPGQVSFGRFTVLTGVHGVGKSYLFSMLWSALPGWQMITNLPVENDGHKDELRGEYVLELERAGESSEVRVSRPLDWRRRAENYEALSPLVVTRLTPFVAMNELEYAAQDHRHLPDPTSLWTLKPRELEALRAITGHAYDWVEYGQIENDREPFVHVRAVRGNKAVDLWSMSSAEFWVHYVLWNLMYSNENDIVLIDEPEAYLARPGHRAFIDEIARKALASGCQAIVATQSEAMLERVPVECLRLIVSTPEGASAVEVTDRRSATRALGTHQCRPSTLVFVEDRLAVQIVRALISRYLPGRAFEFDVIDSEGKNEALAALRVVGRSERFSVVAILDGDQRDAATDLTDKRADDDVLFLPGHAPEEALLDQMNRDSARVAQALGVSDAELRVALDAARFVADHQRIFDAIGLSLGAVPGEVVSGRAIDAWLVDETVAANVKDLVGKLSAAAGIRR